MDDAKKAELEEKIKNCKLKIANEQAKLTRYEAQLAVGKSAHTKKRAKTGQKQGNNTPKDDKTKGEPKEEKGFWATVMS